MLRFLASLMTVDTDDPQLARAQFRSFAKQLPLLYMILVCNAVAIAWEFFRFDHLLETLVTPAVICYVAIVRAFWWLRQGEGDGRTDAEIAHLVRRTCDLAVVITIAFTGWGMWIYDLGDAYARGHVTFFLALTQVSCVFCLMTMRAAAMRVAATSTFLFVTHFSWADGAQMLPVAVVLFFVCIGMMHVVHRYNIDFYDLVCSQRDLRTRKAEAERLSEENHRAALTDALSQLPNRRHLLAWLDQLDQRADLTPDSLAMLFIDLDGFKEINDSHGHHAGDSLIVTLSGRLRDMCPDHAMLARVGGDEFAVLIEAEHALAKAEELARQIDKGVGLPVLVDRHVLQVGASIGIAGNADEPLRAHEILRRADTAMYHVKITGKGGVAVYDVSFDEGRLHRLNIEKQIGRGMAASEFDVVYQPVTDAQSGAFVGAEALVRWSRRPEGALEPQQFIEIAEATGQIHTLGLFVLERACRDLQPFGELKVSVNVSPAQFHDPCFERKVSDIITETGISGERMQLEITEGYLLSRPDRAVAAIREFKELGMSVALDDFGTGFTSIHYLRQYGFSHIKLDKSLLAGLRPSGRASMLVKGAIYLANGLDMKVIAEGVETEKQAQILREAGCHMLQGYLIGRPMNIEQFEAAYRANVARLPRVVGLRQSA
jgi:diguanylate cyclase (GGDEF)-like protein